MTTAQLPSRTTPGTSYTVTLSDDGAATCTCPAGVHGKSCWHARAVRAEATRRATYRVVRLADGRLLSTHATLAEAVTAQQRIAAAGGQALVDRVGEP